MNTEKAEELLVKHKDGTLTPQEEAILDAWYLTLTAEEKVEVSEIKLSDKRAQIWSRILQDAPAPVQQTDFKRYRWVAIAASLILVGSIAFYSVQHADTTAYSQQKAVLSNDVAPGSNKAVLTLADGRKISLTDVGKGEIAQEAGTAIIKTADGQIRYGQSDHRTTVHNIMSTPKGGQYALTLSDGTKVTLNASSSLKYPATFHGKTRSVELEGEAFFDVASDKAHPFIVKTSTQEVEVLGTHFNVNAYQDDGQTKTTLVEGSVKVKLVHTSAIAHLKPGEQAASGSDQLEVSAIDIGEATAWKEGYFLFQDEDIRSIMKKIARWYDIDVVYASNVSQKKIGGNISRSKPLSAVLRILANTDKFNFKIEGRRVTVMP